MTKENNGIVPNAAEVYKRGHSKTADGSRVLVGKKAKEIQARYDAALETAAQDQIPIDPNEAFFDIVGGRKKGGVPGLGSGSDIFYAPGPTRGSPIPYTPLFSQLQGQVRQAKDHCDQRVSSLVGSYEQRLAAQEENQRRMEDSMLRGHGFREGEVRRYLAIRPVSPKRTRA